MKLFVAALIVMASLFLSAPASADVYADANAAMQQELQVYQQYCDGYQGCLCSLYNTAYEGSRTNYENATMNINPYWAALACSMFSGCWPWDGAYTLIYWYYQAMMWGQLANNPAC